MVYTCRVVLANPTGSQANRLVFETPPVPGRYGVYADLYEACGKSSVRFELSQLMHHGPSHRDGGGSGPSVNIESGSNRSGNRSGH